MIHHQREMLQGQWCHKEIGRQTQADLWIRDHLVDKSKFQDSQGYTEKSVSKKQNQTKQKKKNLSLFTLQLMRLVKIQKHRRKKCKDYINSKEFVRV